MTAASTGKNGGPQFLYNPLSIIAQTFLLSYSPLLYVSGILSAAIMVSSSGTS